MKQSVHFASILSLVLFTALMGWLSVSIYVNNAPDLIIKLVYYDISLLTVAMPIGLIALICSLYTNQRARLFTLGWTVYIVFSFVVTLFTSHQNNLFLAYIAIIALGGFYFVLGFSDMNSTFSVTLDRKTSRIVSISLLFSALIGSVFWLSDAINALSLPNMDLYVKAPQVMDMAFILPLTIYGAIGLWRNKARGIWISAVVMIFFVLIGTSVIMMEFGLAANTGAEIDAGKVYGFTFTILLNLIITILTYRKLSINIKGP